jgi:hypothetical protein
VETIWIAQLSISTRTANKIMEKHGITPFEVRDAVQCVPGLIGWWGLDDTGVRRAQLDITLRGRPAAVLLYPRDHPMGDAWGLGSAYFVD